MRKDASFGVVPILRCGGGDRFLLLQHQAGHWGFPKGHAEPNETALAAARREFEEETGIREYQLIEIAFSEHYSFIEAGEQIEKTVTYFPAFVETERVICQAEEIKDYIWAIYDEALQRLSFEQSRQILVQVHHTLAELRQKDKG